MDTIVLQNVSKTYVIEKQVVRALKEVNLKIPRGAIVSVTGKSGAGKSTLLHLIGALDKPTSGSVILNGMDVSKVNDRIASNFRNKTIGFVFQMNNLLPEFSAVENVMMPGMIAGVQKKALHDRAKLLLDAVGLGARLNHRPGELSGGEQQRVTIARALLMAPPILLADEPTGNLDKKTSMEVQDLLFKLAEQYQMTMLLITHDNELAARLPSRIIMEDGCVKEEENLC